jgi:hypothetical protein
MSRRGKSKQNRPKKREHKPPHVNGVWTHCYTGFCQSRNDCHCQCGGCRYLRERRKDEELV